MSLQLAEFNALVVAFPTFVGFLVSMAITNVTNELAGSREASVAELTAMRFCTWEEFFCITTSYRIVSLPLKQYYNSMGQIAL